MSTGARHAATFTLGLAAGVLLALLFTTNATSRQASVPRPAADTLATLRPVAPLRTGAPGPTRANVLRDANAAVLTAPQPSLPTGTGPAATEAASDPQPSEATPTPKPRRTQRPPERVRGVSTWYAYRRGHAAAGPRLRAALGPGWRGETVLVCGISTCTEVLLSDYMGTKDRDKIIDLDDGLFRAICGPLSLGVCDVEVRW